MLVCCELKYPGQGKEAADGPDSESDLVAVLMVVAVVVRRRVGATSHRGHGGDAKEKKRET